MPDDATLRSWVAAARIDLADRLAGVPAERVGRAVGRAQPVRRRRVRDVIGHIVGLAEASRPSVFVDALRPAQRPIGDALDRIARRERSALTPDDLVRRLRQAGGGGFAPPTVVPDDALGEAFTHGSAVLRPLGVAVRPADEQTRLVAERDRGLGLQFGARATGKVRFTATDAGWSVGPDDGPAASGPGEAVLLALAGRPAGVADLTGPGADLLRR